MVDRSGQQFGNYRLIRLLGAGGSAEVYLGEHIHLDTQAAIKVLHTQLASNGIEQFRLEARRIAHLEHPYIVRILEFGIEGVTPFLVMNYAPAGSLRRLHPKGTRLPLPLVVQYVRQLADALDYAHKEKFIHRDIKPENMLLGKHNEVLLSDFGVATIVHSTTSLSMQATAGTISYMAPEQIQESPRPASDQYALGIVTYEWLTGERPFEGTFSELIAKHLSMPPPALREKLPTISPEVEHIVMITLAKDYRQRFSNVQAFANALAQAVGNSSASPSYRDQPQGQSAPSITFSGSDRQDLSLRPVEGVAPGNIPSKPEQMVISGSFSQPPTEMNTPVDMAKAISAEHSMQPPFHPLAVQPGSGGASHSTHSQAVRAGISRRTLLLGAVGAGAAGAGVVLFALIHGFSQLSTPLLPPPGTTLQTFSHHMNIVNAVAWSPDGTRIVSGSADGTAKVWDAVTGGIYATSPTTPITNNPSVNAVA